MVQKFVLLTTAPIITAIPNANQRIKECPAAKLSNDIIYPPKN